MSCKCNHKACDLYCKDGHCGSDNDVTCAQIPAQFNNGAIDCLLSKTERCSERYIEAEQFIKKVLDMPWYKRLFCAGDILRFLKSRDKYNF